MTYVRCKDKSTGHKVSLSDEHGPIDKGAYEVLKGPAVDELTGQPLPPEYYEPPAKKSPARKRASSRSRTSTTSATAQTKEPSDG